MHDISRAGQGFVRRLRQEKDIL